METGTLIAGSWLILLWLAETAFPDVLACLLHVGGAAALEAHLDDTLVLPSGLDHPPALDDVVGQQHLVGAGRPLRRLVEGDSLTSAIFWGPPGTGKTTLALAVAGGAVVYFAACWVVGLRPAHFRMHAQDGLL